MKKFTLIFALLTLLSPVTLVVAQSDISGVWEGELAVNDTTQITVLFTLEANGGGYEASLNAPDQAALTDIAADSVDLSGANLSIAISSISGEFNGVVDDGRIDGTWTQQGTSFPLVLLPYVEPLLSAQDMDLLKGSWVGILRPIPNGDLELPVVFRFEDQESDFITLFDSPSQGANDIPVTDVELDGDQLAMAVPMIGGKMTGTLVGDRINGTWAQQGIELELVLERGEYQEESLAISAADAARIAGAWHGSIGPLTIVTRFETDAAGLTRGYMDSPDQGAEGIPISSATITGDELVFRIDVLDGTFTGTLNATEIIGTWEQQGQQMPTTLSKN